MTIETLPTAAVADGCLRTGAPIRYGSGGIVPLIPGVSVAGRAVPARHRGSVDAFFEAMTRAQHGDVLVIDNDGRDDEGCIGDLTVIEALQYGISGVIVWGRHRDSRELRSIGLPVFSRGACPLGPQRLDSPEGHAAIRVGELTVSSDDVVVADDDGVLFVAASMWDAVSAAAREIVEKERGQADAVRGGITLHQQFRWDEYIRRRAANPAYDFRTHLRDLGRAIEV